MEIKTIFQNHSKSNSKDICKLMEDLKKYLKVSKEEGGIEFDKMPGGVKEYRLTKKRKEKI